MIKKVILTVFCILSPVAGFAVLATGMDIFSVIKDFKNGDIWKGVGALISMILILLPFWYVWKGTKLIPFITIFPIRLMIIIVVLLCAPIGSIVHNFNASAGDTIAAIGVGSIIFLSLWGIWINS